MSQTFTTHFLEIAVRATDQNFLFCFKKCVFWELQLKRNGFLLVGCYSTTTRTVYIVGLIYTSGFETIWTLFVIYSAPFY